MALGGSSKGNSSGSRGRPYGMMLLLAFGLAMLGLMVLHKLRERRIFNLLIKDKDRKLVALQLLLQKERDSTKEVNRKMEEMKAKIYSLRTQKMELSSRVLKMDSITASLKKEKRDLESALEEKQNENKILKEKKISSTRENPQTTALTEYLNQKKAEIEEMKHRLDNSENIWSVSTDDPPKPPVNLTVMKTIVGKDKNEVGEDKEGGSAEDRQLQNSVSIKNGENSRRHENGSRTGMEGSNQTRIPREVQLQKLENNRDGKSYNKRGDNSEKNALENQGQEEVLGDGRSEKPEDFQDDGLRVKNQRSNSNPVKDDSSHSELMNTENEGGVMDGKDHGGTRAGGLDKLEITQDSDGEDLGMISKGGMKFEMQIDGSQNGVGSRVRGRHGYSYKLKGKRWIINSRDQDLEKTGNPEDVDLRLGGRMFDKYAPESEGQRVALRNGELEKVQSHSKTGLRMIDEHAGGNAVGDEQGDGQLDMPNLTKIEGPRMRTDNDDQVALEGEQKGAVSNMRSFEMPKGSRVVEGFKVSSEKDEESPLGVGKQRMVSSDSQLPEPQTPRRAEDLRIKVTSADADRVVKEHEFLSKDGPLGKQLNSKDVEGLKTTSVNGETSLLAANAIEREPYVVSQPEDQETRDVQNPVQD